MLLLLSLLLTAVDGGSTMPSSITDVTVSGCGLVLANGSFLVATRRLDVVGDDAVAIVSEKL